MLRAAVDDLFSTNAALLRNLCVSSFSLLCTALPLLLEGRGSATVLTGGGSDAALLP